MDLTIHNTLLDSNQEPVDIGIHKGQICQITTAGLDQGEKYLNADGCLAVPLFFESHFHLDNTLLWGDVNQSSTLQVGIQLYARYKEQMTTEDIVERATETLRLCLANGVGYLRSHVDIDPLGKLKLLEGVKAAKDLFTGIVDVQIIAFPQMGLVGESETVDLMYAAMENGADVVGGIPHFEDNLDDVARQIEIVFEIARKYNADIDMHVDEVDDPYWKSVELLAEKTIAETYQGRVAAGHCCSMAAWEDEDFDRVLPKIKEADLHIITNPLTNSIGQGHQDTRPVRRGIPPLDLLLQAGVNVATGTDDMLNMFYPFGNMNPLAVVNFAAHLGYLTTPELREAAFNMPLFNAAKIFGVDPYGIKEGYPANLCLLPARNKIDAIRFQPAPTAVIRQGVVVVETNLLQNFHKTVPE